MFRHFTSESVTAGHPDKMADRISDSVLDAILSLDPTARVACETMVTPEKVIVAGETTNSAGLTNDDLETAIRDAIADIGYTHAGIDFHARTVPVEVLLGSQSPRYSRRGQPGAGGPGGVGRSAGPARSRRPGNDVRVRQPRHGGVDAGAHPAGSPPRRTPDRDEGQWQLGLPAPGREDPGHRCLRGPYTCAGGAGADLLPSCRGSRRRGDETGSAGAGADGDRPPP